MTFSSNTIQILKAAGFLKKRNTFFRILGDGVLQIVKMEYERNGNYYSLNIDLFSVYSRLNPMWFTAGGCIARYPVQNIVGEKAGPLLHDPRDKVLSFQKQEEILCSNGIDWLNSINSQQKLIDGICHLETSLRGKIYWIDDLKIIPFLLADDIFSAKQVINSILEQHKMAYYQKKRTIPTEEYHQYMIDRKNEDAFFEHLLQLIEMNDFEGIKRLANKNYNENIYRLTVLFGKTIQ